MHKQEKKCSNPDLVEHFEIAENVHHGGRQLTKNVTLIFKTFSFDASPMQTKEKRVKIIDIFWIPLTSLVILAPSNSTYN